MLENQFNDTIRYVYDYSMPNVSEKVMRIILGYTDYISQNVWKKIKSTKIIFLSGLYPKELENAVLDNSKVGMQNAANSLQWSIVEGLVEQTFGELSVVNSMYIGSYPFKYRKIFIEKNKL